MSNAAAFAALDAHIKRIRTLPDLARTVAPKVTVALKSEITKTIAASSGPDGKPWPLRRDGERALQDAASAVTVRAQGTTIIAELTGIEARHHFGAVRGKVKRPILPTKRLPEPAIRAIKTVLEDAFGEAMAVPR